MDAPSVGTHAVLCLAGLVVGSFPTRDEPLKGATRIENWFAAYRYRCYEHRNATSSRAHWLLQYRCDCLLETCAALCEKDDVYGGEGYFVDVAVCVSLAAYVILLPFSSCEYMLL